MEISRGKAATGRIGKTLIVTLLTAAALLLVASLLVGRMKLKEEQLGYIGAGILFFVSLAASLAAAPASKAQRPMFSALLCGLVIAVTLLMIGFLSYADNMSAAGVIRVAAGCLSGAAVGGWLKSSVGREKRKSKFTGLRK